MTNEFLVDQMFTMERDGKVFVELPDGTQLEVVGVEEEAPADEDTHIIIKVKK